MGILENAYRQRKYSYSLYPVFLSDTQEVIIGKACCCVHLRLDDHSNGFLYSVCSPALSCIYFCCEHYCACIVLLGDQTPVSKGRCQYHSRNSGPERCRTFSPLTLCSSWQPVRETGLIRSAVAAVCFVLPGRLECWQHGPTLTFNLLRSSFPFVSPALQMATRPGQHLGR